MSRLLDKNYNVRLGSRGGLDEILNHPWLKQMDIDAIMAKRIPAPMKPELSKDVFDVSNFDKQFTREEVTESIIYPG